MRRTITVVLSLAAVAFGAAGTASAAASQSEADEHRRIVSYWTAERRASAKPLDLIRPAPAAKPGGGGGGGGGGSSGGGTTTVTGATWTKGGPVTLTTGKVFFNLGASRYTCSGSAVQTSAGNAVLTAGHCVHESNGGPFATNWIFYPGWNAGAPHPVLGAWTATDLFTTPGWADSRDFDDDAGIALVTGDPGKGSLAAELAALGATTPNIAFGTSTGSSAAFGYPASKKYKGNTLTWCAGDMRARYDGAETLALACDMTGGSSGGPWFAGPFDNDGTDVLISLNSYGYASVANTMFGPIFDAAEQAAYNAAAAGGCTPGATLYRCTG